MAGEPTSAELLRLAEIAVELADADWRESARRPGHPKGRPSAQDIASAALGTWLAERESQERSAAGSNDGGNAR